MIKPEIYTKSFIEKLGNAIIFLCQKLSPHTQVSKTHILKLIFILEELSVKKYGIPFFNLRFDVWKLGPVSKELFVELSDEPTLLADFISKIELDNRFVFYANKEFSDDEFSDNEIELLEFVTEKFKYCSANELINFTHRKNSPWFNAAQKHGMVAILESGLMNTTDIEIDLSEIIQGDEHKLAIFNTHKEFIEQSKSLKV